jgi:hypothetical protein
LSSSQFFSCLATYAHFSSIWTWRVAGHPFVGGVPALFARDAAVAADGIGMDVDGILAAESREVVHGVMHELEVGARIRLPERLLRPQEKNPFTLAEPTHDTAYYGRSYSTESKNRFLADVQSDRTHSSGWRPIIGILRYRRWVSGFGAQETLNATLNRSNQRISREGPESPEAIA